MASKGKRVARKILSKSKLEQLPNRMQLAKLRLIEAKRRAVRRKVSKVTRKVKKESSLFGKTLIGKPVGKTSRPKFLRFLP